MQTSVPPESLLDGTASSAVPLRNKSDNVVEGEVQPIRRRDHEYCEQAWQSSKLEWLQVSIETGWHLCWRCRRALSHLGLDLLAKSGYGNKLEVSSRINGSTDHRSASKSIDKRDITFMNKRLQRSSLIMEDLVVYKAIRSTRLAQ